MKGIDTLPPGPLLPNYDFRVTYYEQPIDEQYRATITSRLMAGVPPLHAVRGTPVRVEKAKRWQQHLGIKKEEESVASKYLPNSFVDGYDIVDMYLNKNMSLKEIAAVAGCHLDTVHSRLQKLGVTNMREHRRKNKTAAQKRHIERIAKASKGNKRDRKKGREKAKIRRFLKNKGHIYLPLYQDVKNGMPMGAACKKHGINPWMARYYFKKMQRLGNRFLEYGQKRSYPLKVTKAQWSYWEKAAKMQGINVLDWIKRHLNAAAKSNA